MSWEDFSLFCAVLFGVPIAIAAGLLVLAAMLIGGIVASVCAVPVGVAWALAALVRPEIVTGRRSLPPPPQRQE